LPRLPPGGLKEYTKRTITQRAALMTELDGVRTRGYAFNYGEREEDLHAVAAPVWGPRDALLAIIGVQGPVARFGQDGMNAAVRPLLDHTLQLSRELGWSGLLEEVVQA
ncbi:MAG: IclR family transcriptional regulator domain-containing protein, partial [Gaiellaceae bacterium]